MYTVSKGSRKIVAKARRGISQNLDRSDRLDAPKKAANQDNSAANGPKPIFHITNKRVHLQRQQEVITPQHEEIIRYINESWNSIRSQHDQVSSTPESSKGHSSVMYYNDGEPSAKLQNFVPFDLESWWGKRLFNNITESHKNYENVE